MPAITPGKAWRRRATSSGESGTAVWPGMW